MRKKKIETEMVEVEARPSPTANLPMPIHPEVLIQQAIDKGVPVETMEKLLAMRKELRAEAAKSAFDEAMAKLQGEMPTIKKTKIVKDKHGVERYRYAPIDAIVDQTKEFIARNGFSYAVTTEQSEVVGEVKAICTVKHEMGHSEASTFRVPIDKEAYMSGPQKVGAALTFAKRYAFCNAFGIITGDEDNDANETEEERKPAKRQEPAAPPQKTREELMRELHAVLAEYKMPREAMKEAYKVESMNDLADNQILVAITTIRARLKKGETWKPPEGPKTPPDGPKTPGPQPEPPAAPKPAAGAESGPTEEIPPGHVAPPPVDPAPEQDEGAATIAMLEEQGMIRKGMATGCQTMMFGKACGRAMPCAYHPVAA